MRHNLTIADALYVVVALHLAERLVTTDRRLANVPNLSVATMSPQAVRSDPGPALPRRACDVSALYQSRLPGPYRHVCAMSPCLRESLGQRRGDVGTDPGLCPVRLASAAMTDQRIEVQRQIAADPGAIFAVLRDPSGHVAIDASGMLMSADGGPVEAVGDRFVVHMDRDSLRDFDLGEYDVTVVISAYEPDRHIAWTIEGAMDPPIGHVYGYRLEPVDGGTLVTSYYDWSDIHEQYRTLAADVFPIISETGLLASLGILARTVAPGVGRPGAKRTEPGSRSAGDA